MLCTFTCSAGAVPTLLTTTENRVPSPTTIFSGVQALITSFGFAHPQAGLDVAGAQAGPGFREDIAFARGTQVQDQFLPLLRRQGPEVPPEHISLRRCPGLGPGKIQPPGNLGADGNLGQGQVRGILDNESQVDRLTQTAGGRTNPFQAESCFLTTAQRTLRAGRR